MDDPMIAYDPERSPGETAEEPTTGGTVKYVSASEYFSTLLSHRMSATQVFLAALPEEVVPREDLPEVDDQIAETYWHQHGGCLIVPPLLEAIQEAGTGAAGASFLENLEAIRREIMEAGSLDEAETARTAHRIQCLELGAATKLTDRQVATGELFIDYMFLQRAIAEDIRTAESQRSEGQTRAEVLEDQDREGNLLFEGALASILRPQTIVDAIPDRKRPGIEQFARRRYPHFKEGLLRTDARRSQ